MHRLQTAKINCSHVLDAQAHTHCSTMYGLANIYAAPRVVFHELAQPFMRLWYILFFNKQPSQALIFVVA